MNLVSFPGSILLKISELIEAIRFPLLRSQI